MTKYKDLSAADKEIRDYYEMKWVRVFGYLLLAILGVWMIVSPAKPKHASIEKVTVSLIKDLWGLPLGIILLTIALIALAYFIHKIVNIRAYAWIRFTNGYYLYFKRRRVAGLASAYHGKDLLVFHPENQRVLSLKDYSATTYQQYIKAEPVTEFNNDDIYWTANDQGYTIIYKGQALLDTTSEYRGDDLYVKSPSKFITLRLQNYKNLKDGTIRKAVLV